MSSSTVSDAIQPAPIAPARTVIQKSKSTILIIVISLSMKTTVPDNHPTAKYHKNKYMSTVSSRFVEYNGTSATTRLALIFPLVMPFPDAELTLAICLIADYTAVNFSHFLFLLSQIFRRSLRDNLSRSASLHDYDTNFQGLVPYVSKSGFLQKNIPFLKYGKSLSTVHKPLEIFAKLLV